MKKKLCCILMLMVLLLNSSIMLIVSEAVEALTEEKVKALAEINLTKYENFDTTEEGSSYGSKGVLVQFNLKTGIEFAEGEEYVPVKKTTTNIDLPYIGEYKPSIVEVITKSTQATNGGKEAKFEYHQSTGILSIIAENEEYTQNVVDARDEYEIICIYKSECYTENEENNIKVQLNTYETLNNEDETTISAKAEGEYICKEAVSGVISTSHKTDDIYNGYIEANKLNSENKYETTYNETLKVMISNKELAKKIEVKETSETSLYTETRINKENVLEILGSEGSLDILDENENILQTIKKEETQENEETKETEETDEDKTVIVKYENRTQNLFLRFNNVEKEGIVEIENSRVIEPTAQIEDNKISTQVIIKGINPKITETEDEEGKKVAETEDIVKYERKVQSDVEIKQSVSEIDFKLDNDVFVNNTENNVKITATLKTNSPKYSLYQDPIINLEMPAEVEKVQIGQPYMMNDNNIFNIISSDVQKNENGNNVVKVQLQGTQTSYETSSLIKGADIEIPLTISLTQQLENKVGVIKCNYSNKMDNSTNTKDLETTLLNKIVAPTVTPEPEEKKEESEVDEITDNENTTNSNFTTVYEKDGIKVEVIEKVGTSTIENNGTIYERQIIKNNIRVTNNNKETKNASLTINIPDELTYVELEQGGWIKNENKGYYKYSDAYDYNEKEDKQVKLDFELNAGEAKTDFIELKVKDLADDVQEKELSINYSLKLDNGSENQFSVKNKVKQAEVAVFTKCLLEGEAETRRQWSYVIQIENLTNTELKNVKVEFEASSFFAISEIEIGGADDINDVGKNKYEFTVDKIGVGDDRYQLCIITGEVGDIDESKSTEYEIKGIAKVTGESGVLYESNITRMTGYVEALDVGITVNKDEVFPEDEIEYIVTIKNVGKTFGGYATYTNFKITDVLPRELDPKVVIYNSYEILDQKVTDEEDENEEYNVESYIETTGEEEDITELEIPAGYTEENAPNVNMELCIPEGKTIIMKIKAEVKANVKKNKDLTNTIKVTGDYIKTKTASVTTKLTAEEELEEGDEKETTPTEKKITISGKAWIDENKDGKITTGEKSYKDMKILLYDDGADDFVKENDKKVEIQTNSNGEYRFENLNQSKYRVIFLYDADKYIITEKPKDEESEEESFQIRPQTILLNGKETIVGITDIMDGENDLTDINLGLVEREVTGETNTDKKDDKEDNTDKKDEDDSKDDYGNEEKPGENKEPEAEKYSISGIAWIDENEDGRRTSDEKTYNDMTVMLFDYKNNTFVKENGEIRKVKTNSNGEYEFDNLEKGQYIVVFLYDTGTYNLTKYHKEGISIEKNSDATTKTIGMNGETVTAGLTDTLDLNEDLTNIDIGLVEKKSFDLDIKKYISKITVQTSDQKTKTYDYDGKQFAKIEIHSKKLTGAIVIIEYKIIVTNNGELDGKAVQVIDNLPEGLKFQSEMNSDWYENNGKLYTNSLAEETIGVGENKEISLVLTKEVSGTNLGTITNIAEIGISNNEKAVEDGNLENNKSTAEVIIGVSTGIVSLMWIIIFSIVILSILGILIWNDRKILKTPLMIIIFTICIVSSSQVIYAKGGDKTVYLKGVIEDGRLKYAYDSDGSHYYCISKGHPFCRLSHKATLYETSTKVVSKGKWTGESKIKISEVQSDIETTTKKIGNGTYNIVGPFKVKSNTEVTPIIYVKYTTTNGDEIKLDSKNIVDENGKTISNFKLKGKNNGKDGNTTFYIKTPSKDVGIEYIDVQVNSSVKQKRTVKKQNIYKYHTEKCNGGHCTKDGRNNVKNQNMKFTTTKSTTETRTKKYKTNVKITPKGFGRLVISKIGVEEGTKDIEGEDNEDIQENIKIENLSNVKFVVKRRKNKPRGWLSIKKDGKLVSQVTAREIKIDKSNYKDNGEVDNWSEISAEIDGVSGYTFDFTNSPDDSDALSWLQIKPQTEEEKAKGIEPTLTIYRLPYGSYYFKERVNKNYGYTQPLLHHINMYDDEGNEMLDEDDLKIPNPDIPIQSVIPGKVSKFEIENIKDTGTLEINKKDSIFGNNLGGVSFRLKSMDPADGTIKYIRIKGEGNSVSKDSNNWIKSVTGNVRVNDSNSVFAMYDNILDPEYVADLERKKIKGDEKPVTYYTKANREKSEKNQLTLDYTTNKSYATVFKTDTNGKMVIQNLLSKYMGEYITYYFEEDYNPNYGYEDTSSIVIDNSDETEIQSEGKGEVVIDSMPSVGKLIITKVDSADNDKKLSGEKFAIKSSYANGYVKIKGDNGWLKNVNGYAKIIESTDKINSPTITYTSNKNDATKFVTDSEGKVVLENEGNNKIQIESNDTTYVDVGNKPTTADLKIIKVDSNNTNQKLSNVEFVIRSSYGNGYIKIKGTGANVTKNASGWVTKAIGSVTIDETTNKVSAPTLTYTSNKNDATKFVTDSEGKIIVENLLSSSNGGTAITYTAEETYNPNYTYSKVETTSFNIKTESEIKEVTIKNTPQAGDIYIKKTDDVATSKKLPGVEFVLKSSNGGYIRIKGTGDNVENGSDGWATRATGTVRINDSTNTTTNPTLTYTSNIDQATKFVTNSNSEILIKNLLTSTNGSNIITYELQEVYNPNYGYLLNSTEHPITFESTTNGVVVTATNGNVKTGVITPKTGSQVNVTVKNHQEYIRIEGYVWEEIINSKNNMANNLYDNTDALIKGLNVYLYKDGKQIASQVTDENGYYCFGTKKTGGYQNTDYTTESNGNLKIDDLSKYYVEFEYDGLKFTSVQAIIDYQNSNYAKTSKATEVASGRSDKKDRNTVNNDFATISYNKSTGYDLEYDYSNNKSTYKDRWGYTYNNEKTKLTVTPASDYYAIIASTATSGFNLKSAWDAKGKTSGLEVLSGINLGIQRRAQADLAVSSDIDKVSIKLNTGENIYENEYSYAKRNIDSNDIDTFGIDTKFGNNQGNSYSSRGLNIYTRRIYESDLAYSANESSLMQIYVTYKIKVKNQSTSVTSAVKTLVNYYDSRYELSTISSGNNSPKHIKVDGVIDVTNGYKAINIQGYEDVKLGPGESFDFYIKFKLNDEAIKALISKQTTLNNVTEITEFSSYNADGTAYAAIDEDSNPGSAELKFADNTETNTTLNGHDYTIENKALDTTSFEDDTDMAPSFIIGIEDGDPVRGLSGTVFEDSSINGEETKANTERIGNGILDNNDKNRIGGVKVELLESTGDIAKLHKYTVENGILKTTVEDAIVTTDDNGEYIFAGVMPGTYQIRYTYTKDSYIIKDGEKKYIDPRDYKSTIITSDGINKALKFVNEKPTGTGDHEWILKFDGDGKLNNSFDEKYKSEYYPDNVIRYSTAVDNIDLRDESGQVYYNGNSNETNLEMTADTAFFMVGIEYTNIEGYKKTYTDYKDEYKLENGKIVVLDESTNKIKLIDTFFAVNPYQDFGIIERPRLAFDVNKRVSDLKITLGNGQVLVNGNPYETTVGNEYNNWDNLWKSASPSLPYIKALPNGIVAEIDSEIIQGAKLDVEFTISIINKSELDYTENSYYYYGTNGVSPVKSVIRKVVDYMDADLEYDDERNTDMLWEKVTADQLKNYTADGESKQLISNEVYEAVKEGYTIALYKKFGEEGSGIEPGTVGTIKMYGNKVLYSDADGISVSNHTEIVETAGYIRSIKALEIHPTPGNYDPDTESPNETDDGQTKIVITPPTGLLDNPITIIVIIAVSLVVLAGGIILIKKNSKK